MSTGQIIIETIGCGLIGGAVGLVLSLLLFWKQNRNNRISDNNDFTADEAVEMDNIILQTGDSSNNRNKRYYSPEVVNSVIMGIDRLNKEKSEININDESGTELRIKVKYHHEINDQLIELQINPKGDFIDLRNAVDTKLHKGDFALLSFGISIQLPEGYYAEVVPRSSTFKNWGIIQTNSVGIIDESYCGDNDIWKMPVYATRDTEIFANERTAQFRIVKKQSQITLKTVENLGNSDRGGFGSTGKI